jgi:hypothetical protein
MGLEASRAQKVNKNLGIPAGIKMFTSPRKGETFIG